MRSENSGSDVNKTNFEDALNRLSKLIEVDEKNKENQISQTQPYFENEVLI
jgi:hypothetical protein